MYNLTIPIKEDTFVYTLYPNANYSSNQDIFLQQLSPEQVSRALIKIPLENYDLQGSDNIVSAKLYMLLMSIPSDKSGVNVYRNEADFDYSNVTWRTKPSCTYAGIGSWVFKSSLNQYAEIDITDLVKQWESGAYPNYGLQLGLTENESGTVFLSSRTTCYPYVVITTINECFLSSIPKLRGLQMQAQGLSGVILNNNDTVNFDTVISNTTKGVSYDTTNGTITLSRIGNYYLNWWVSVEGGLAADTIFLLKNQDNSIRIKGNKHSVNASQVIGSAFITVGSTPQILSLINASGSDVQLDITAGDVQANIEVMQVC